MEGSTLIDSMMHDFLKISFQDFGHICVGIYYIGDLSKRNISFILCRVYEIMAPNFTRLPHSFRVPVFVMNIPGDIYDYSGSNVTEIPSSALGSSCFGVNS